MNFQVAFNFVIGLLTVAATIYVARVAKRGKDADLRAQALAQAALTEQADRQQRFAEIVRSLEEARADLVYYKKELAESRQAETALDRKVDKLQTEWRQRHRELLERCQEMSDVVQDLLKSDNMTPDQRSKIRAALLRVRRHISHDHDEIDHLDTDSGRTA